MIETIGIVGHGSFGKFIEQLAERFLPEVTVKIFDRTHTPGQGKFVSFPEVAKCQVVVVAVPIRAYAEIINTLVPVLGEDSIVVDVATVKEHPARVLSAFAYTDKIKYVSTHPMFGPYSYEKKEGDLSGFRLVIAEHNIDDQVMREVIGWLEHLGLEIQEMTPTEHDLQLAGTLFLTHYVAQVVKEGEFTRTDIDTVSFGFLMDAVESVQHDEELFKDVYRFNPYCEKVIKRFIQAEKFVHHEMLDYK